MKHFRIIGVVAIMLTLITMAMPSISSAQYPDERLNNFLSNHADVRAQLMRNPNLIYDRQFRHEHPDLQAFMQDHPNVWGKLPDAGRWGAYGDDHRWHEADWWHEHNPNWINEHHPEWMHDHPDWGHEAYGHPAPVYAHPVGMEAPHTGVVVVPATAPEHHHDEHHHDENHH